MANLIKIFGGALLLGSTIANGFGFCVGPPVIKEFRRTIEEYPPYQYILSDKEYEKLNQHQRDLHKLANYTTLSFLGSLPIGALGFYLLNKAYDREAEDRKKNIQK